MPVPGKPVWTWPSVVAVDAGAMQIQLGEGTNLRFAEAVLQAQRTMGRAWKLARARSIAKTIVEEGARKGLFGGESERYGACRGARGDCAVFGRATAVGKQKRPASEGRPYETARTVLESILAIS
jgi:hypothetical protein